MSGSLSPTAPLANGNGHIQDARIHRTPSHESLTAHPLLSPGLSNVHVASGSNSTNASPESARVASPKYLPYTPRHARAPTSAATTGAAVSAPVSVSPSQLQPLGNASATSKLQLQNLKAAAQDLGLDGGSLGWAMLEELVCGTDRSPEWNEIWGAITAGKATMLLPLEQASSSEMITPELVKDHIVFCNGSARNNAPVVTLTGLRGVIDEKLYIRSVIPTTSKAFASLSLPSTRTAALASLPLLPEFTVSSALFPQYSAPSYNASLPIPPRASLLPKPPLPPRPGARPPAAPPTSRISNPFASFFAKSPTPVTPAAPTVPEPPHVDRVVEVPAFTIDRPVVRRIVAKALTKGVRAEIKESLAGLPTWVVDRTQAFCSNLIPFPKKQRTSRDGTVVEQVVPAYSVAAYQESTEALNEAFQAFYEALVEELKVDGSPATFRRREERHNEDEAARKKEKADREAKVYDALERVERTLCCVFYDRLFRPSDSDDALHDEALSSRIAALNMLDLTLDHLGVDVGLVGADVDSLVKACGETISQLEVARCPADKASILVAAHKIIADGLTRLPPLRLKSDEALENPTQKTPKASTFGKDTQTLTANNIEQRLSAPGMEASTSTSTIKATSYDDQSLATSSIDESAGEAQNTQSAIATEASTASLALPDPAVKDTPLLTMSPPMTPTTVSGDILLPLIIFSVVKANPVQLVSHLLYTQRFRNKSVGGEESYSLINLMAVVEFLENVDLGALGLKEGERKVLSTADLTPIPLAQAALATESSPAGQMANASLRGRVEQQVDAIAGSANKVLSGVVDSSFGVLRALLPVHGDHPAPDASDAAGADAGATPWNSVRPGFGLLRRESGFSIASLAASLPRPRERARSVASHAGTAGDEDGQEMVESRPGSVRSFAIAGTEDDGSGEESESESEEEEEEEGEEEGAHDARSIRSFESMMSSRSRQRQRQEKRDRLSLSDRLANMSRLTRRREGSGSQASQEVPVHRGSPPPRSSSLLAAAAPNSKFDTPMSSRTSSPVPDIVRPKLEPPSRRFLECSADDLRMAEVRELLQEYRRLVEGVRAMGAFDET